MYKRQKDDSAFRVFSEDPESLDASCTLLFDESAYDALICADDEIAAVAQRAARNHGIRVPEDLMVTGYNDSVIATIASPAITSLDNRAQYMCTQAVYGLTQVLDGKEFPEETMYSGKIVERESTKRT